MTERNFRYFLLVAFIFLAPHIPRRYAPAAVIAAIFLSFVA